MLFSNESFEVIDNISKHAEGSPRAINVQNSLSKYVVFNTHA